MLDLLNAPRFIETKKERKVVLDRRPWSEEELAILNDVYSCSTKEQIIEALPHRTWDGIKNQAIKLGLKMSPMKVNYKGNASRWTELEFNLLRWFWPSAPMSVMHALLPGRSEKAMIFKASGLGLKRNNQMLPYQVDIIRQVNKLGKVETMKRLPDYTWKQISTYARDKLDITFNAS